MTRSCLRPRLVPFDNLALCLQCWLYWSIVSPAAGSQFRRVVYKWPQYGPANRSKWPQFSEVDHTIIDEIRVANQTQRIPLILGVSIDSHDCTLAVVRNGRIVVAVELERVRKERYLSLISSGYDSIDAALYHVVYPALVQICMFITNTFEPCALKYEAAVVAWGMYTRFSKKLSAYVKAKKWIHVDHHHAHAAYGWLSSPFYHQRPSNESLAVVLSYDGSGNDGTARVFTATPGSPKLHSLGNPRASHSFGYAYDVAASLVRDLSWGSPYGSKPPCPMKSRNQFACTMALPGSFMAFAAIGNVRNEWRRGAQLFFKRGIWHRSFWPSPFGGFCDLISTGVTGGPSFTMHGANHYFACNGADEVASRELDRDFAATAQAVFESVIVNEVRLYLKRLGKEATSLVISGGCALNVKANSALARSLDLPTHVPSAPGDNGLAVGAAWLVSPPDFRYRQRGLHHIGLPLMQPWKTKSNNPPGSASPEILMHLASKWGASKLKNVEQLAKLLYAGAIVGVARGRAEFGPRALGRRSLLAAAHLSEQKDRLNRLKNRRWYRPCAPIMLAEDLGYVFQPGADLKLGCPYMSFAPPLRAWVKDWLPAVAHIDNTARPQGVGKSEDRWMHSLLVAMRRLMAQQLLHEFANETSSKSCLGQLVGQRGKKEVNSEEWAERSEVPADTAKANKCIPPAVGVLINTSLNPKGKPIASDHDDVLSLFCETNGDELDAILLEDWLFMRDATVSAGFCASISKDDTLDELQTLTASKSEFPDSLPPI